MASSIEQIELAEYRLKMYRIVIPIFVTVSVFAVLANGIVIAALRRTRVRNATVTLILSLACSDIFTSCVVAVSLLYSSYLPTVLGLRVNPCIALTLEMCRTGGLITGTIHLLLIAANHFITIVRPHSSKKTLRRLGLEILVYHNFIALALCFLSWVLPVAILVCLSFSFENEGYYNCLNVRFYHSRLFRTSVSALLFTIFLLIIWFYCRLLYILRTHTARWRSKSAQNRVRRENRTLFTAILICSSFFVGWLPASIHFTITCDTCSLLRGERFKVLFLFSCIQLSFILGKSFLNPLIYSLRLPEVDVQIRSMLTNCGITARRLARKTSGKYQPDDILTKKPARLLAPHERLLEVSWNEATNNATVSNECNHFVTHSLLSEKDVHL